MPSGAPRSLKVRGAAEHNLRAVDVQLEHGCWTAIVGPSGSGKTSLVFDVILAEGERRYLGAASPKARQFFGKLGRAAVERIDGLPVPMAVARRSVTSNPRSTVGTQSGALDLLRLLFAREANSSEGPLTRSHFSFNAPSGACPTCGGLGEQDEVDPGSLIADPARSIRDGALAPTLKSGYTVYSQVTLEVMDTICRAHSFDVDTPWSELSEDQRHVVLHGTKKLVVPFGKHSLESRMKWEGITARPREEGHYRGIVPVIAEILSRGRNPSIMRYVRSATCPDCDGSRLAKPGREARLAGGETLPELCALTATALRQWQTSAPSTPVAAAVGASLTPILARMERLGLGHLSLDRPASTLSGGEAQRLRLAAHLTSGLSGALYALDEPTLGLHPESQPGMRAVLDELVNEGNTLVVVEHDPDMVGCADRALVMGPGAGPAGGRVVDDVHAPVGLLDTELKRAPRTPTGHALRLEGATLHNLKSAVLTVERGVLNVVLGPSGAGKSSLVFGTLLPAIEGRPGGPFTELTGAELTSTLAVDARPMGRSSRSTPATWSGLFELIRKRFAAEPMARELGFGASHFSFNGKKSGRCVHCEGLGEIKVGLHLFEDARIQCPVCRGARYDAPTMRVRVGGKSIADVLAMDVDTAREHFAEEPRVSAGLEALHELGLGYLKLGAPSTTLSSGEAQRIRLATILAAPPRQPSLFLFDEPDRGLHPGDLLRLIGAFDRLCERGHTVLAVSHHQLLWRAADALVEVREGVAKSVEHGDIAVKRNLAAPVRSSPPRRIELRGVRTHNLRGVDVDIPHRALTAIIGPSGSGKSSLAFDTIAAEAWRRYNECLPFQVRRFMERAPAPELTSARGLSPVVALGQAGLEVPVRSTVATILGLAPILRLLFARAGSGPEMLASELRAQGGPASCAACAGQGKVRRCSVDRLLTDGSKSLSGGAMGGTKPGAFFTEPEGRHLAVLREATGDDLERPFDELPEGVRRVALHGAGERVFSVTWRFKRGQREGEHTFEETWPGLLALVEAEAAKRASQKSAAAWAEPLEDVDCSACGGCGLRPEVRERSIEGLAFGNLWSMSAADLRSALEARSGSGAAFDALAPDLAARLQDLEVLGGGHFRLDDRAADLSAADAQRLRLAGVLRSGLCGVTFVLDEPGAGLDAEGLAALLQRLKGLAAEGNTVVAVTHREEIVAAASHVVALGPGSGSEGGEVIGQGEWEALGEAARSFVGRGARGETSLRRGESHVHVGEHHLPIGGALRLSGPGASAALRGIADSLRVDPSPFDEVLEPASSLRSRTVLTVLDAMGPLQVLYAGQDTELPRAAFSFASPKGRCPRCKGSGIERVSMDFTADLSLPCETCGGARYRPEVLEVRWEGMHVAELLATPLADLDQLKGTLQRARRACIAAGLGHLALGRPTRSLSGGELQRLAAAAAAIRAKGRSLLLFESPERGLSAHDVPALIELLDQVCGAGHSVVIASEDPRFGPMGDSGTTA